jgi:hypothetical protein
MNVFESIVFPVTSIVTLCTLGGIAICKPAAFMPCNKKYSPKIQMFHGFYDFSATIKNLFPVFATKGTWACINCVASKLDTILLTMEKFGIESQFQIIWERSLTKLGNIANRIEQFSSYEEGISSEKSQEIRDKINNELVHYANELAEITRTFYPQMPKEVEEYIIHDGSSDMCLLPQNVKDSMKEIGEQVHMALAALPSGNEETQYLLESIQKRYLPDTITRYLDAQGTNPEVANILFGEQAQLLIDYTQQCNAAIGTGKLEQLQANGAFLQARFSPYQRALHQHAG